MNLQEFSDDELRNNHRGLTVGQERERIRLMQTGMASWPQPLKDSLEGKIACMETIIDGVVDYVRTLEI